MKTYNVELAINVTVEANNDEEAMTKGVTQAKEDLDTNAVMHMEIVEEPVPDDDVPF